MTFALYFRPAPILLLLIIAIFVFEVVMFIHAIRNPFITGGMRAFWLVGMLLIHPIVAIVYYFTEYKKQA